VTKSSFENSSISSDIEIVGSQQLAYTESTDATTDLNRFVSINDGYLDEIHSLRNEYQADVCVLIVDSLLGVNGLAASIGAEYSTAFFVVNASATLEDLSFSHELGHLLGCRHDNDIGTLPYGNARGYDWYGKLLEYSNNLKKYKTIMSIKEGSELRVPFFSNPYVNDDGSNPIGTLQYNYAAYAIDDYSSTIAAFQPRYTTSGTISVNEWWRGTLNITGNVTINSGVKLTIEPNATINFSSGASLIINGELIANGATLTNSGTWGGIQFNSGSTGNIYNCIITNATNGIYCYNSSPTIRNSILEYNNTGLSCSYYSSPVLRLNSFRYNSINGISCNSNSSPDLGEDENSGSNAIRNNLIGLKTSYNSNPDLHGYMVYGNSVFDNTGNEIEATYYCTINADRVFWGNGATIFPYSSTVTNTNPLQYNPNPFQSIIEKSEPNQILSKIEAINTDQPQDELTEALYKQREKI
jgi:hypothetical protein